MLTICNTATFSTLPLTNTIKVKNHLTFCISNYFISMSAKYRPNNSYKHRTPPLKSIRIYPIAKRIRYTNSISPVSDRKASHSKNEQPKTLNHNCYLQIMIS